MDNETNTKKDSLTREVKDSITLRCLDQLRTSRNFKRARLAEIKENEDLYAGVAEKTIRNPFNECFPFMAGFVDHLRSKIDDDSNLAFSHDAEADLKRAQKIQSFYEKISTSADVNDSWELKHRYAKNNAIFSGLAIYKYYADKNPDYCSHLSVISHYDFHFEPRGGGILEKHLFCGQDNIFKNTDDIKDDKNYDETNRKKLFEGYDKNEYKDNQDVVNERNNRFGALKQDPSSNSFVGQSTVKLIEWYTTYQGKRYYVLFNETSGLWLRVCPIEDLFPDGLYPYVVWQTNEDADVLMCKAPCDDARPVAKIINTMINQELYNRQKRNYGQRIYDPNMFPNIAALSDWRPDGLIPANTKGGTVAISSGFLEVKVGDLNGTLDLVTWLEQFTGKAIGYTSSDAGASETDKKVGVFKGEIAQTERLIGIKNKSYRYALTRLGLLFKQGLEHNLTKSVAVKVMGGKGIEWTELTVEDLKTEKELNIQPAGGTDTLELQRIKDNDKLNALELIGSVNPQWKDRQILLIKGFTEEDLKDAWNQDSFAKKELLSEAAQAEKDIVQGKTPKMNRGADANFMQHIIDFATDTEDLDNETYNKLIEYAMAHTDIAVENEIRNAQAIVRQKVLEVNGQKTTGEAKNVQPALPKTAPVQVGV